MRKGDEDTVASISGTTAPSRDFLFLQGLASHFFERLGVALSARGHRVHRVNFNGGDRAFWRFSGAVDFSGRQAAWTAFLDGLIADKAIAEIVLFGDCRPLHRDAVRLARERGCRVWVVEEGYLRPGWITFEEGGVNGHSSLPREPGWYRATAHSLPEWRAPPKGADSFRRRALEDVHYNLACLAGMWRFPHYRTHRPVHPLIEYIGWGRKLALSRRTERRAAATIERLRGKPFFLFPLQLDADYQLRVHSPFGAMRPALDTVLRSFGRHAPTPARLVVKLHPFECGLVDWAGLVRRRAVELGAAGRVIALDGGDLERLLSGCDGVVTVNSTVGTLALGRGVPVIALGNAVYDMPGLTCDGGLDRFWSKPTPPDPSLFDAFRRVLAARAMIPGSFFSETGLRLAVAAAIARLEAPRPRLGGDAASGRDRIAPPRAIARGWPVTCRPA